MGESWRGTQDPKLWCSWGPGIISHSEFCFFRFQWGSWTGTNSSSQWGLGFISIPQAVACP